MRIRAVIVRIARQFIHDKRTMALLVVAPLLVLSLMYLVFNGDTYQPKIGTVELPAAITEKLTAADAKVTAYDTVEAAEAALADQEIDAFIRLDQGAAQVKLEGSDPSKNQAVMLLMQKTLQGQAAPAGVAGSSNGQAVAPEFQYLHGSADMSSFDSFSPVLIGLFAFFFVFLIAGVSFLRERTSGTLERLLATPLRRWEIVVGYMAGFGIFTSLQAVLIAGFTVYALGSLMVGSFGYVLLIMLLLSLTALSFGTLLSAFANTEFQMIQFIPIVIVPQVFFSGLFDLESISPWLRWITHITPLKYGADALRGIMIRGEGWSGIALDVYVLAVLSLVFMLANVLALRKHRKI
ncbi:ABC transporter permease [Paenibacillus barengoltzii]|jgi:ABC-2 type transport system permease protein|uniref:DrrB family ABC transporter efflux protein n=1 Tax=Paenibacillus barengoltzii G22 TaxID=1235795 RepID=R9L928_9BACL|nr:ABC transporter permease [Paenibacillus barengoltzii]EOS55088.1 DrrB family ABC transporter efflux protein [Paenibacillus barengoltzii G22]